MFSKKVLWSFYTYFSCFNDKHKKKKLSRSCFCSFTDTDNQIQISYPMKVFVTQLRLCRCILKNTQHGSQIIFRFLRHHIKDKNHQQIYHYSLPVVIYLLLLVLDKWIGQLQNKITDLKRSLWGKQDDQTFHFIL